MRVVDGVGLPEALEDVRQELGLDADAGVGHVISMCELDPLEHRRATVPPFGVNLIALTSRFQTTCCSRFGSPETGPAMGSRISEADALGFGRRAGPCRSRPR